MRLVIKILIAQRSALRANIGSQTHNAEYYYADAQKRRVEAQSRLRQAEYAEKNARSACEARNQFQAQLNEVDKAIALLEKSES